MIKKLIAFAPFVFAACQPATYSVTETKFSISERSVVSIIEPAEIVDEAGIQIGIGYAETCNAFSIIEDNKKYLVSAKHCFDNPAPGTSFKYISPDGFGSNDATIAWVSTVGDRIFADVNDDKLVPLRVNDNFLPVEGDIVYSYSSLHKKISSGIVIGELTQYWFDTTQTVDYGWSGSPVFSDDGYAWGIIHGAFADSETLEVLPKYTIVSTIY